MNATIPAVLAERFVTCRDEPAVICDREELRYGQLDALTAGASDVLSRHGVMPAMTVGLVVDRGLLQVACLVAIVRAGWSFCFLDRRSPPAWNRDVVARAGITHVVADGELDLGTAVSWIRPDTLLGGPAAAPVAVSADDPVYVNFSSGTTGAPKVIPCTHRGVVGFCHAPRHVPAGQRTRFVYSSPLTFDASQLEIWMPLLNGGCVVVNGDRYLTPEVVRRLVRRDGANTMWLTSSLLNALIDIDPTCLDGICHLIAGGEELSPPHVVAAYRANPAITIFNGYGPTETTIITTMYEVPRDHDVAQRIPIGRAIDGSRLVVVGEGGRFCDPGEIGELVITGVGVSPGYLGDSALNSEKFTTVVLDGTPVRGYWTGDLVSRSADELFHYHGRRDDQLKIRGHRVALSDVARAFDPHPGVRSCAVIAVDGPSGKQLALCYVPEDAPLDHATLAAFAAARLPDFMVPRVLVALETLPLTSSGKVDRAALAAQITTTTAARFAEHGGAVAALVRRLANLPDWRLTESFFDAGGDSLGAIRLVGALEQRIHSACDLLGELYRSPTLEHLLSRLPNNMAHHSVDPLVNTLDDEHNAEIPLSPAQRSMVYPEVLHGDRTYNNVVYLLQENVVRSEAMLAGIHAALIERFPLLGCVVVDADDGYAFEPAADATRGVDLDLTDHDDVGACVSYHLARSISLFEGPLLTVFRVRIGGRVHVGVRFHHVVGDHIGQTEILRAIVELASGGAVPRRSLSSLAAVNRRLVRRAELEHDDCRAFWASQKIRVPEVAARPLTDALSPCVRRRRVAGARRDRVPSEQMLRWLAATAAALENVFAIRDPVVHCLFSLREQEAGLGFQTCLAPVALTSELISGGEPTPALLDTMLATRRHCVIGLEELMLAADLSRARIPFLFNFVDLRAEDHRWWSEHLLDARSEPCKTELDVTVVRAGDVFDVTITTRYDAGCADAILDRLDAAWR